nr:extracellular matrix protein 1-like [Labrus bergylta]
MISMGCLTGFWIIALLTLHGSDVGESKGNSLNEPDIPFPPARPTPQNLAAICHQGQGRPRYPASFFSRSGGSRYRRLGNTINRLESWYRSCCSEQESQILCCTTQAWKETLSQFCVEEYSTKTLAYECCEGRGDARWICFNSELPNPDYNPTLGYTAPAVPPQPEFTFNASAC